MTKVDQAAGKAKRATPATRRRASPSDYAHVLADMKRLIADSRHRALATVNRQLVYLYWHIGRVIVHQQETANWGDAVVEQLATDLRAEFPDMVGLTSDNLWRMRKFFGACREIGSWLSGEEQSDRGRASQVPGRKLGTLCPQLRADENTLAMTQEGDSPSASQILGTLSPQMENVGLQRLLGELSWSTGASWREPTQRLMQRHGPAALGFLEAILRAADARDSELKTDDPALEMLTTQV